MPARKLLLGAASIAAAGGGLVAFTLARVQGRARGDLADYLADAVAPTPPVVVAGARNASCEAIRSAISGATFSGRL